MIRVGIVGVSGFGGGELVRILSSHSDVELTFLGSETYRDKDIGAALPNMRGYLTANCRSYDPKAIIESCDVVFLAQHNGWAMKEAAQYLNAGLKVIDLSADFRIESVPVYEKWYKLKHESPELIEKAVYGLPEIWRKDIAKASLVANVGCYPTGAILAMAPLLAHRLTDNSSIIIDSKSGVSGAGRSTFKLDYHFPELNESMKAYNVGVHRHTPEIEQEISKLAGEEIKVSFTPHLIPITRGILTTVYADLKDGDITTEDLIVAYQDFYKPSRFVVVLGEGEYPSTKNTCGSNFCHIGIKVDPRTKRVVVISALDNLIKGMAGTAVQCMNLMCGLDEEKGLMFPGVHP